MYRASTSIQPSIVPPVDATKPASVDEYVRAAVVLAVRRGALRRGEARAKYMIADSELCLWEAAYDHEGISGLRNRRLSMRRRET
jgi:hypothetical protein